MTFSGRQAHRPANIRLRPSGMRGEGDGMGFFDDLPAQEPEPPRRHHQPWEPPEAEFPGIVPVDSLLLGRTDRVAVAITGLAAVSNGLEIFVTARMRPAGRGDPANRGPDAPRDFREARHSFRLGMQFSDGTKVLGDQGRHGPPPETEPTGPILHQYMGGGSPHTHVSRWWAWPLPPKGPLDFVSEWPAFGIGETRAELDAQLILDAADRSIRLWPDDEG
jgi:hypothetical protein